MLAPGAHLGAYEVLGHLGAGGMGEVYRAKDTKLGRDVALKILPASFTNDPERVARFRREAQVLASLNHPHIAQIYGLEEANGTQFLVLELVDGESLDKRIARGRIPVDEALGIAKQIAEALEAAHEKGIIHRDLKPANIALTTDGQVKVLDFGLAKAIESTSASVDAMASPTITTPVMMTGVGVILGTAAYMAPEQAKGRLADKRSDVWAFGCVLFEMLTGKRAFDGEDVSDTLAAVLRGHPDWTLLPPGATPLIRLLLARCLEKDRGARIADMSTARFLLTELLPAPPSVDGHSRTAPAGTRAVVPWTVAALGIVAAGVAGWQPWKAAPTLSSPTRFTITPTSTMPIAAGSPYRDLALSPDGENLVFVTGLNANNSEMWVRPLGQLEGTQLRGIKGQEPFISPDGKWIGFFADGELKKVSITGGPAITLGKIPGGNAPGGRSALQPRGATWGTNDVILFAVAGPNVTRGLGLFSVPSGGGEPKALAQPAENRGDLDFRFPFMLPSGKAALFTVTSGRSNDASIALLDLATGTYEILVRGGGRAEYVPSVSGPGYIVYAVDGSLRAVPFDPNARKVLGNPVPVVDQVLSKPSGAAEFSVSRTGALVYVPGALLSGVQAGAQRTLVWVDRAGHEEPINAPARAYQRAALSPDGTRLALDIRDQDLDVWTWDVAHETLTRLTTDRAIDSFPVWTGDGKRIVFASARDGSAESIYWQPADGSGPAERLTTSTRPQSPLSLTPDGRGLIFRETRESADLFLLHLDGTGKIDPLVQSAFNDQNGIVSPDGKWLAYDSNPSGKPEVFVRPYPNVGGGQWQVSKNGGRAPLWSPNGRELFYADEAGTLLVAPVLPPTPAGAFNFGPLATAVGTPYYQSIPTRNFDISKDGKRFLMIKGAASRGPQTATGSPVLNMIVVLNWIRELEQRVPTK